MVVPPYCRSRAGRVFRIQRRSERLADDTIRYVLKATALGSAEATEAEASRNVDPELVRDKIKHRQLVPTPEEIFEQLWQQLRLELDSVNGT